MVDFSLIYYKKSNKQLNKRISQNSISKNITIVKIIFWLPAFTPAFIVIIKQYLISKCNNNIKIKVINNCI